MLATVARTETLTNKTLGTTSLTGGSQIKPSAELAAAIQIANAAGTTQVSFDTANGRVGIGSSAPARRWT